MVFDQVVVFAADSRVVGVGAPTVLLPFSYVVDFSRRGWYVAAARVAAVRHKFCCFAGAASEQALLSERMFDYQHDSQDL